MNEHTNNFLLILGLAITTYGVFATLTSDKVPSFIPYLLSFCMLLFLILSIKELYLTISDLLEKKQKRKAKKRKTKAKSK